MTGVPRSVQNSARWLLTRVQIGSCDIKTSQTAFFQGKFTGGFSPNESVHKLLLSPEPLLCPRVKCHLVPSQSRYGQTHWEKPSLLALPAGHKAHQTPSSSAQSRTSQMKGRILGNKVMHKFPGIPLKIIFRWM